MRQGQRGACLWMQRGFSKFDLSSYHVVSRRLGKSLVQLVAYALCCFYFVPKRSGLCLGETWARSGSPFIYVRLFSPPFPLIVAGAVDFAVRGGPPPLPALSAFAGGGVWTAAPRRCARPAQPRLPAQSRRLVRACRPHLSGAQLCTFPALCSLSRTAGRYRFCLCTEPTLEACLRRQSRRGAQRNCTSGLRWYGSLNEARLMRLG